jgi:hypothetical protein
MFLLALLDPDPFLSGEVSLLRGLVAVGVAAAAVLVEEAFVLVSATAEGPSRYDLVGARAVWKRLRS